jgi:hypothetical protein
VGVLEAAVGVMAHLAVVNLQMVVVVERHRPLATAAPMVVAVAVAQVDMYIVGVGVVVLVRQGVLPVAKVAKVGQPILYLVVETMEEMEVQMTAQVEPAAHMVAVPVAAETVQLPLAVYLAIRV